MSRARAFLAVGPGVPWRVTAGRTDGPAPSGSAAPARRPLFSGEELCKVGDVGDERLWM